MKYQGITLQDEFQIEKLYSLHYFEYMSTFYFPGESHDFWEFICVDKGTVTIGAEEDTFSLEMGDIAFHQPNEFHWVKANDSNPPNLIVISFSCHSPYMDFFRKKVLHINNTERTILAQIIAEAQHYLTGRLDNPYQGSLSINEDAPPASAQMIKLQLEQLLILLYRRYHEHSLPGTVSAKLYKTTRMNNETEIFNHVVRYLKNNLTVQLTIEKICRDNLIGRSQLQKIFHEKSGLGIMGYFLKLKIDTAMYLIRSEQMNFTQISENLGYSSIHYFSRQFKKLTGMSPSEYASSIKAMVDRRG